MRGDMDFGEAGSCFGQGVLLSSIIALSDHISILKPPPVPPISASGFCAAFTDLFDASDHRFDFCSDFFAPLSVTLS